MVGLASKRDSLPAHRANATTTPPSLQTTRYNFLLRRNTSYLASSSDTIRATKKSIHFIIKGHTMRARPLLYKPTTPTLSNSPSPNKTINPPKNTPVANIIYTRPIKHPKHSTRPCRNTEYMVQWCSLQCSFQIAQAHQQNKTRITYTNISPLFATYKQTNNLGGTSPPIFSMFRRETRLRRPQPHPMRTMSSMDTVTLPSQTHI